jgi:hypothetical protein
MSSSVVWRRVALVRTGVKEKLVASIIRVNRTSEVAMLLLCRWFVSPWWGRWFSPKHQFSQEPHGIIFQKMAISVVTAVRTSNLKSDCLPVRTMGGDMGGVWEMPGQYSVQALCQCLAEKRETSGHKSDLLNLSPKARGRCKWVKYVPLPVYTKQDSLAIRT